MERIDQTAVRALRTLLDAQPTTGAKVECAWKIAAGPAVARASSCRWSSGTLHVRADSEPWRAEIARARVTLTERMARILGPGVVRSIVVDCPREDRLSGGGGRQPFRGRRR